MIYFFLFHLEMTCCHVSKVPKNVKTRNLKELLNGHNESYRFPATNLHIQCKCLPSQRYCLINGYGTTTTRYQHRKQQFGRWHEEPAFGSRYAFDNEITFNMNRQTNSVTNTPSAKTKLTTTTMQNDMNSNSKLTQPNDIDDNGDGVNDDVDDDDDDNSNNRITMTNNNNNNDQNHRHHTALIKSSSIDTIAVSVLLFFSPKFFSFFPFSMLHIDSFVFTDNRNHRKKRITFEHKHIYIHVALTLMVFTNQSIMCIA